MVDGCKPDWEKFKGNVIEFNKKSGDRSYFVYLYIVQKVKDSENPGEDLVNFMNNWSMRRKTESTKTLINDWYSDNRYMDAKFIDEYNWMEFTKNPPKPPDQKRKVS
jgi:hypothetical protein